MDVVERNKLVCNNLGLAHYWANRCSLPFDDALQLSRLGLITAADKWEPTRGKYGVIAGYYCRHNLQWATVLQKREANTISLDTPVTEDGSTLSELTPDEKITSPDQVDSELWTIVNSKITKADQELIKLHFVQGYSLQEIANKHNLSRERISQKLKAIYNKLRKHLQDYVRG